MFLQVHMLWEYKSCDSLPRRVTRHQLAMWKVFQEMSVHYRRRILYLEQLLTRHSYGLYAIDRIFKTTGKK